jgi:glutaredoxin
MEDKKQREVIIYTMKSCAFCKQLKDFLNEKSIEYIEKDTDVHQQEWEQVKSVTMIPMFPTILLDDEYFIPQRDFQTAQQGAELINYRLTTNWVRPNPLPTLHEGIKTVNGAIGILSNRLTSMSNQINALQQQIEQMTPKGETVENGGVS